MKALKHTDHFAEQKRGGRDAMNVQTEFTARVKDVLILVNALQTFNEYMQQLEVVMDGVLTKDNEKI